MKILPPGLEDVAPAQGQLLTPSAHTFQCGHLLDTHIIGYSSYNHSGFVLLARKLPLPDHPGKEQRQPVGATHEPPLQHHLAEGEVDLSGQKPVELDQQP